MINKKDIIKNYNLGSKEVILIKVLDKVEQAYRKDIVLNTDFLDPLTMSIVKEIIDKYYKIPYKILGGYNNAERKVLILFPEYLESSEINIPLKIVNIEGIENSNHRSVLGSILNLGISREKVGDIIIHKNLIQVVVRDDIAEYISFNLLKIGNRKVKCNVLNVDEIITPEENSKMLTVTVPSLRLDVISAIGFKESRNNAASNIKRNKVSINHRPVNSTSHIIKEGDLISFRGKGRIKLDKILGTTKKDRIKIVIKKYL